MNNESFILSNKKINELIKKVAKSTIVLFVGAGISNNSGLPLQDELKSHLLENLCRNDMYLSNLFKSRNQIWIERSKKIMLEAILQYISNIVPNFVEELIPIFLEGEPTEYHYLIAELLKSGKLNYVITTNFDDLIERAYKNIQDDYIKLSVIFKKHSLESQPTIIKLHGCATKPKSVEFTLTRIGKGLDKWKTILLEELSLENIFNFIGYSDQDKDITPVLNKLDNEWIWMLYSGIPLSDHVQEGSLMERMLLRKGCQTIYVDPLFILKKLYRNITDHDFIYKNTTIIEPKWKKHVSTILGKIPHLSRIEILGTILSELFAEPDDSEKVFTHLLSFKELPLEKKVQILLKRNAVRGNRWDMDFVKKNLDIAGDLLTKEYPNKKLVGLYLRQRGDYYQQMSIDNFDNALESYELAREYFKQLGDKLNEAWTIHNIAVTLYKSSKYKEALPLYERCIKSFKELAELDKVAISLNSLGSLQTLMETNEDAIKTYEEAIELFHRLGKEDWVARCFYNIAEVYVNLRNFEKAQKFAVKAKNVFKRVGDIHWLKIVEILLEKINKHE